MKHIKTYEAKSRTSDKRVSLPIEVINDLRDICLELTDEGYMVNIKGYYIDIQGIGHIKDDPTEGNFTYIDISPPFIKGKYDFKYEDISEIVERIKDYLDSIGYKCNCLMDSRHKTFVYYMIFFTKKENTNESLKSYSDYFTHIGGNYHESRTTLPEKIQDELKDILC